jgi:hypothetical protein
MPDEKLRTLELIGELVDMGERSSRFWKSFNRIVLPANAFGNLVRRLVDEIPVDIKKAKELIEERERLMDEAVARSERIVDEAVGEAQKLLDESEVVRKAERVAAKLREDADTYVITTLERLEDTLAEILSEIKKGQNELIATMEKRRESLGIGDESG